MSSPGSSDVLIIGNGIIAYASAIAIARSGGSCSVVGRTVTGAASPASAGLLAPSLGKADPDFHAFMTASRDRYPPWVEWIGERTGTEIVLNRMGIIVLAAEGAIDRKAEPLDDDALRALEPAIVPGQHASLFREDGYVDNVQLLSALRIAARAEPRIAVLEDHVTGVAAAYGECALRTERGLRLSARCAVLAAGAWSTRLPGLPRAIPIEPVRGQMLQLRGSPLNHAVALQDGYLVPRGDCTLVGSTMERVGFETATDPDALNALRRAAASAVPEFAEAEIGSAWAGLRPMTPDGMPILGCDPEFPALVYACGHGKNGVLLAPITGECVAQLAAAQSPPFDLNPFRMERFEEAPNSPVPQ